MSLIGNKTMYDWELFMNGRLPVFTVKDPDDNSSPMDIYFDYFEEDGCLYTGGLTNSGFYKDGQIKVEVDGDFHSALMELYDRLSQIYEMWED